MRYQLSDDQAMIRDSVRRFAESEVKNRAYDWDGAASAAPAVFTSLADLGLMGMRVSEAAGGTALDPIATLSAVEALAAADGGLAWTVALHNLLALPALEAAGHDAVSSLAAGEGVAAWFEAPLSIDGEGGSVRVSGVAPLVPWARRATLIVGRIPDADAVVVVAPTSDGVRVTPTEGALGLRSSAMATVRFEAAPVQRLDVSTEGLDAWWGLSRSSVAVGVAQGALAAAAAYAQERQQFNRPIAQFQAVQWMLAETATEIDAAQLLTFSAMGTNGRPDPAAVARASLYALPAATRAGMRAVQVYGGNGYVREYPVERCLRDAKTLEVLRAVDDDQDRIVDALLPAAELI